MSRDRARRSVRHRQAALAKVETEAVKEYWQSLELEERLSLLRFEDPALLDRLFTIQEALHFCDFKCYYLCGLRGQDAVRQKVGLDAFDVEAEVVGGGVRPMAFFAKRSFVARDDLFELLERQLGPSPLEGLAPARGEWASLFDATPNTWAGFMRQVLRLVGLAILRAQQSAAKGGQEDTCQVCEGTRLLLGDPCPLCGEELHAPILGPDVAGGRSSKKRAKRKRGRLPGVAAARAFAGKVRAMEHSASEPGSSCPVCEGTRLLLAEPCPLCGDETTATPTPRSTASCTSRCAHAKGACLDIAAEAQDARSDAEASTPTDGRLRAWPVWRPNGLAGDLSEWSWIDRFQVEEPDARIAQDAAPCPFTGLRAIVRNTFVEIAPAALPAPPAVMLRACSVP